MQDYEELQGLLGLAREIHRQERILVAQSAQPEFKHEGFPAEFVQVVSGQRDIPSLEELREMRPRPQQVFDAVVLKQHCEQKISERFSIAGHHVAIDLEVLPEERR
jgi:hypothetical protein